MATRLPEERLKMGGKLVACVGLEFRFTDHHKPQRDKALSNMSENLKYLVPKK